MGQSAATAAVMAIDAKIALQVPYAKLRKWLLKDGQILNFAARPAAR